MQDKAMAFALHPSLDLDRLRAEFAQRRRVEIRPFLTEESAQLLRHHLRERQDWRLVLNAGEKVFEIERSSLLEMDAAQRATLERKVVEQARHAFQYRFETIRVPDARLQREESATLLDQFAEFLSSPDVLDVLRFVTGFDDVAFADAQATSYGPGDFLTRHDDDVEGKNRRAAYVLGLTPGWRSEWGGLLLFHGADGNIDHGFAPAMGALRLFAVPADHSVSYVTPMAPEPRLSVTGWLRTMRP